MLTNSQPFTDAVKYLTSQTPKGSPYKSAEWTDLAPDVRTKSFFSARVENVRFLDRGQSLLGEFLNKQTEEVTNSKGVKSTRIKVGSRADFVRKIREFQIAEGMATEKDFLGSQTNIRDIRKLSRLQLIFDTNIKQAFGFGKYKQGMNPVVLNAFPAARFVRLPGSREPRPRHTASQEMVRLKTDNDFWALYQNAADIGGFEVPYAPFGFNSNMSQRDVSRKTAEKLGLVKKGERVKPATPSNLTDKMKSDLSDVDPGIIEKFRKSVAKQPRIVLAPIRRVPNRVPDRIPDRIPDRMPDQVEPGMTAFISPRNIPNLFYSGAEFVFLLGHWRSLTGDDQAKEDELNKFDDEETMIDKIKRAFGDAITFS